MTKLQPETVADAYYRHKALKHEPTPEERHWVEAQNAEAAIRQRKEIDALSELLMHEFGGPKFDESAVGMAIRVLKEQREQALEAEARIRDNVVRISDLEKKLNELSWAVSPERMGR